MMRIEFDGYGQAEAMASALGMSSICPGDAGMGQWCRGEEREPSSMKCGACWLGALCGRNDGGSPAAAPLEARVKYFEGGYEVRKIEKGDWIDISIPEDVEMKAGEYKAIRLGIGMILPEGHEAVIASRSSTFAKYGILPAGGIGIVDNSFSGDGDEWVYTAYATRDVAIERGSRICQFRIFENQPPVRFETAGRLNAENRGGLGSTGEGPIETEGGDSLAG